jgi:ABC-type polysaccharide transport system permease subunit
MFDFNICAPALIYVAFSLTQIIIDTFNGLYNTALLKGVVMIIITILLNSLCQSGMGIISWIIVFIPFIFMSVIVAILLYVFGLNPATGKINVTCSNCPKQPSNNLTVTTTTGSNNSNTYQTGSSSDPQFT